MIIPKNTTFTKENKTMKKLTLLIALIVAVTIGGVYATWTYANENAGIDDDSVEILLTIPDAKTEGSAGTLEVSTNNFGFKISQLGAEADTPTKFHLAVLKLVPNTQGAEPEITLTFTPSTGTNIDAKMKGINAYFYFTTSGEMKYEGTDIFSFGASASDPHKILPVGSTVAQDSHDLVWVPDNVANPTKFTCTIKGDDILTHVKLTQDFVLDTVTEHSNFKAAANKNIALMLTDTDPSST